MDQAHQETASLRLMGSSERYLSPALYLSARFRSFDELAQAVQGWDLDWQQLDPGRLEARLEQLGTASCLLSRVDFSRQFHQLGSTPAGMRTFGFLREGVDAVRWCGAPATADNLMAFGSIREYESVSGPRFGANTLSFSEDLMARAARTLGLPVDPDLRSVENQVLDCDPRHLRALRSKLRQTFEVAAAHPGALFSQEFQYEIETEVPVLLLRAISRGIETPYRRPSPKRIEAVGDAMALIREAEDPPKIREICEVVGVSERTLRYAFVEQLGVGPKQYLQAVRLNGVRRDLCRWGPDTKVVDVANRWGFWHMGQFAADYRRQFGELPSETLRRR